MPYMKAKMVKDWVPPYEKGTIPVVIEGDHPRFVEGTRLDWGFVQVAIGDGWTVSIEPFEINRSNCTHPDGFIRTGILMMHSGKEYRGYWCDTCRACRYILKEEKQPPEWLPTDHKWDYVEDIL